MFKKRTEVKSEVEKPEVELGTLRLVMYWDDTEGLMQYRLERYQLAPIRFYDSFFYFWESLAIGDKAWAERTAQHYSIEMPEEVEDDSTRES